MLGLIKNSQEQWSSLLRSRILRGSRQINHHKIVWLIGDGSNINFWNDNWCAQPLPHLLQIPISLQSHHKISSEGLHG